ncbi:hypothetical protein FHS82_001580 [Pseudochelatococcus lubricantis]|uniref:DUF2065 domain-containing protein n=1 Tax=Pseudochelatococcus lubricantis TaxID=1538102 RepID=A0ABX0V0W3_9HYPH|nr:DUF2065 family protein [Pseudochelatococcus lubricantis]NIJ57744.1 hypothetical protein [Pseudochelatococcus lubricantis]
MTDFLAAFGLLLALEGIFFAALPGVARRVLSEAADSPVERMRLVGIVFAVIGVVVVWTVRRGGLL